MLCCCCALQTPPLLCPCLQLTPLQKSTYAPSALLQHEDLIPSHMVGIARSVEWTQVLLAPLLAVMVSDGCVFPHMHCFGVWPGWQRSIAAHTSADIRDMKMPHLPPPSCLALSVKHRPQPTTLLCPVIVLFLSPHLAKHNTQGAPSRTVNLETFPEGLLFQQPAYSYLVGTLLCMALRQRSVDTYLELSPTKLVKHMQSIGDLLRRSFKLHPAADTQSSSSSASAASLGPCLPAAAALKLKEQDRQVLLEDWDWEVAQLSVQSSGQVELIADSAHTQARQLRIQNVMLKLLLGLAQTAALDSGEVSGSSGGGSSAGGGGRSSAAGTGGLISTGVPIAIRCEVDSDAVVGIAISFNTLLLVACSLTTDPLAHQ